VIGATAICAATDLQHVVLSQPPRLSIINQEYMIRSFSNNIPVER